MSTGEGSSLKGVRRPTVTVGLLLCMVAVWVASVASAARAQDESTQSTAELQNAAPPWTYDPSATYAEGDIAARTVGEGITRDEAIRRFRVEDAVAGVLEPTIEALWPDTFAGLWITTPPDAFGVSVAFTSDAQANVDQLRPQFPFPNDLRAVDATMPLNVLLSIQDEMTQDRTALQNGTPPADLPQAIKDTNGRYDLGTDIPSNMLVVSVDEEDDALLDAFRSAYTDRIVMREGLSQPASCTQTDCRYAMMGGLELEIPTTTGYKQCSSAFTAFYTADPSRNYVITAGHCDPDDQPRQNAFESYGDVTRSTESGNVDAERVKRTFPNWRESGKFLVLAETNPRLVLAYTRYADMVLGEYIGKTGITTGTTRGYVRDLHTTSAFAGSYDFVRASFCVEHGDSGGAVWRGNAAWGIVSAGVVVGNDGCRNINGNVQAGAQGIFGAVEFALDDLGLTLRGNNLAPDAAMTSSCNAPTCSFSGSGSKDEDGSVTSYAWNFGDGTTGSGATVSHTYAGPGTYSVTLTVTDNNGATDVASQTLDLRLNPPILNSAAPTVGVCGVVLSWMGPSSGVSPTSYDIYRSTTSGGPYSFIKNVAASQTSTTDTTVARSKTYYYVLKSVRGTWKSANSNQKSAATGACV